MPETKRFRLPVQQLIRLIVFSILIIATPPGIAQQFQNPGLEKLHGRVHSPSFSPSNPNLIAYARQAKGIQELYLYDQNANRIILIDTKRTRSEQGGESNVFSDFFEEDNFDVSRATNFNGQFHWRPVLDSKKRQWFVFVSSGGSGDFDLYLSYIDKHGNLADEPVILKHAGTDQFPKWSPDGRKIAFVSGETGGSDIYLIEDVHLLMRQRGSAGIQPLKLTTNPGDDNYPAWSPDGRYIAYQSSSSDNGIINYGINVIDQSKIIKNRLLSRAVRLTRKLAGYHEYKPSWSPDGQYLAFYIMQGRQSQLSGNRLQDIGIVAAIVGGEDSGIESGAIMRGTSPRLAENVIPKKNSGPTWFSGISVTGAPGAFYLIYTKRDENRHNPIIMTSFNRWLDKKLGIHKNISAKFGTRLHRDVTFTYSSFDSRVAFVSQVGDVNSIQVHQLKSGKFGGKTIISNKSRSGALLRSAVVPGWGQFYTGSKTKAILFAGTAAASAILYLAFNSKFNNARDNFDAAESEYMQPCPGCNNQQFQERFANWQDTFDETQSAADNTQLMGLVVLGVWALNLIDSQLWFPNGRVRRPGFTGLIRPEARVSYIGGEPVYRMGAQIVF